jgi:hypothetical protein
MVNTAVVAELTAEYGKPAASVASVLVRLSLPARLAIWKLYVMAGCGNMSLLVTSHDLVIDAAIVYQGGVAL